MFSDTAGGGAGDSWKDIFAVSYQDVLFAIGLGIAGQLALGLVSRWPAAVRCVWLTWVAFCVACVAYGVVAIAAFRAMGSPLTYRLIHLGGDMRTMSGSVRIYATPWTLAALFVLPPAYIAFSTLMTLRRGRMRFSRRLRLVLIVLAVSWCGYGSWRHADSWWWHKDRYLANSPHVALLWSLYTDLLGSARLGGEYPPEFRTDFTPIGQRPPTTTPSTSMAHRPRNVILLVLESTGSQFLGLYGSEHATTPCLQAEAANSLVFDNFYCHCCSTASSLFAMCLSTYPQVNWRESTEDHPRFPGVTLADLLRSQGYRTCYFAAATMTWAHSDAFLKDRGFDALHDPQVGMRVPHSSDEYKLDDRVLIDDMLLWIDEDHTRPFFAMAWTNQAHHPYVTAPDQPLIKFPGTKDEELNRYLNCLAETDRQIGRLLAALRQRGLADDTLVVITGDHGEAFRYPHDTFHHGFRVYEECVKVPMVLWNPRLFQGGGRRDLIAGHVDINPTVAELLGFAPSPEWQGRSLFAADRPPRAYFYAANADYRMGVRDGNWKLIYNAVDDEEELFDLSADPQEQTNLAAKERAKCQELRQRINAWIGFQSETFKRRLGGE